MEFSSELGLVNVALAPLRGATLQQLRLAPLTTSSTQAVRRLDWIGGEINFCAGTKLSAAL
jgi:hypothetical protein